MGERSHLVSYLEPAEINLDLQVKDVVQLLEYEGLERVVLVGHAYAGMVITGSGRVLPGAVGPPGLRQRHGSPEWRGNG
jgi:pimeloyl-ACP methyl ester carboxylesterase